MIEAGAVRVGAAAALRPGDIGGKWAEENVDRRPLRKTFMPLPLAIASYLTIWWVVLFAILPFGVRSQHEAGDITHGTDPGAPVAPRLLSKALWTTLVASIVFAGLWAYVAGWV